ncbi:MAG: radical SAM family heme chaperone HemW [Endomicrobium sp.]|jgi:oxygen-independent coproporphyrinogen-3 oxidase|nr:radical SAM family heme chaperone HemW [Endomicrobium sp.]
MLGLYIHIPFCKQKCFYCDFFSEKYNTIIAEKYINTLINHAQQFQNNKIDTIYIGGGTPSILSLKQIKDLLSSLNRFFDITSTQEFTFELNPESISKEKLQLLKSYGVNRLSIGLQAIKDETLKFLGRIHDFKTFCNIYDIARKEMFNNINIDLIYGLPNQTVQEWQKSLENIMLFDSQHLSLYPLTIEQSTPFYKRNIVTNDNIQKHMYKIAVEILEKKGYIHYEISNWARNGKQSLHNSNYWHNFEYIGLGAGASGYINRNRYKNVENIKNYINLIKDNSDVKTENEYINNKLYITEKIILGLRLLNEGVDIDCFNDFNLKKTLLECLANKTLKQKNKKIILAKESVFISNQIISKFVITNF